MNRIVVFPALFIAVAVSACSGDGGTLTPAAPAPVTQSQTGDRAAESYGGIPALVRLPVTLATACPSPAPSPTASAAVTATSRKPESYGGIPAIVSGVTVAVTVSGCGS